MLANATPHLQSLIRSSASSEPATERTTMLTRISEQTRDMAAWAPDTSVPTDMVTAGPVYAYHTNSLGQRDSVYAIGIVVTAGRICPSKLDATCFHAIQMIPIQTLLSRLGGAKLLCKKASADCVTPPTQHSDLFAVVTKAGHSPAAAAAPR